MSDTEPATDSLAWSERAVGLAAAIGAVVMVSTAVFTIVGRMGQHNVVVGAAIAAVASALALKIDQGSPSIVLAAVLAVLGAWTAASPFVFDVGRNLVVWLNAAGGGLVALLSAVSAYGILRPTASQRSSGAAGA